jgi:hypothetical protein
VSNPWNGKAVLEAFWWNCANSAYSSWYTYLAKLAPRIAALGFDSIWTPPIYLHVSGQGATDQPFAQAFLVRWAGRHLIQAKLSPAGADLHQDRLSRVSLIGSVLVAVATKLASGYEPDSTIGAWNHQADYAYQVR